MMEFFRTIHTKIKMNLYFFRLIRFPIGKKAYFIGTPEYSNLGDSEIAIAQMLFLEKCGYKKKHIKEFTQSEYNNYSGLIYRYIGKRHLICGIGGGNMGNLWYNEELFRYSFIDQFPNNPIIIFPQTVFFTDDEDGEKAKKESLLHYNTHSSLTLVAREKQSFSMMNSLYKCSKVLLTPDIVLSTRMEDYGASLIAKNGKVIFQSDKEKKMTDNDRSKIQDYLIENNFSFRTSDMYSDVPVTKDNRVELVRKKMQEFSESELVITDRLHGMVFAALTGTPCIVFSNNHHKVQATYDWISYLPYIKLVNDYENAISLIPVMLRFKDCMYNNEPIESSFYDLSVEIKKHVN